MVEPPPTTITCVDCGGRAHLVNEPPVDEEDAGPARWAAGDVATYRCADCLDRWDLVLDDDDD